MRLVGIQLKKPMLRTKVKAPARKKPTRKVSHSSQLMTCTEAAAGLISPNPPSPSPSLSPQPAFPTQAGFAAAFLAAATATPLWRPAKVTSNGVERDDPIYDYGKERPSTAPRQPSTGSRIRSRSASTTASTVSIFGGYEDIGGPNAIRRWSVGFNGRPITTAAAATTTGYSSSKASSSSRGSSRFWGSSSSSSSVFAGGNGRSATPTPGSSNNSAAAAATATSTPARVRSSSISIAQLPSSAWSSAWVPTPASMQQLPACPAPPTPPPRRVPPPPSSTTPMVQNDAFVSLKTATDPEYNDIGEDEVVGPRAPPLADLGECKCEVEDDALMSPCGGSTSYEYVGLAGGAQSVRHNKEARMEEEMKVGGGGGVAGGSMATFSGGGDGPAVAKRGGLFAIGVLPSRNLKPRRRRSSATRVADRWGLGEADAWELIQAFEQAQSKNGSTVDKAAVAAV